MPQGSVWESAPAARARQWQIPTRIARRWPQRREDGRQRFLLRVIPRPRQAKVLCSCTILLGFVRTKLGIHTSPDSSVAVHEPPRERYRTRLVDDGCSTLLSPMVAGDERIRGLISCNGVYSQGCFRSFWARRLGNSHSTRITTDNPVDHNHHRMISFRKTVLGGEGWPSPPACLLRRLFSFMLF